MMEDGTVNASSVRFDSRRRISSGMWGEERPWVRMRGNKMCGRVAGQRVLSS